MEYKKTIEELIDCLGGTNNISKYWRCTTRLRFNLYNYDTADLEEAKKIPGIVGVVVQGAQIQAIVGADCENYFNTLSEIMEKNQVADNTIKRTDSKKEHGNFLNDIIAVISDCFTPILPAVIGGGMLKGFIALAVTFNLLSASSDTYSILSLIADAPFYFLPFLVAVAASKKFNVNTYLSIWLAGCLLYPTIVGAYETGAMNYMSFFGVPMLIVNYTSSIIPIMLGVWILSKINKAIDKRIPASLKMILVPMVTMFLTAFVVLIAAGPLASYISVYLEKVIAWLFDFSGAVGGIVFGGLLAPIVVTGMHWVFLPAVYQSIALNGFDYFFMPIGVCSNVSQGIAAFALAVREKKDKDFRGVATSTGFMAVLGITEPAMYAVTLQNKRAFLMALVGSALGSAYVMAMGCVASAFATPGLLALPLFIVNGNVWSLIHVVIGIVITTVTTFTLVYFFGSPKTEN